MKDLGIALLGVLIGILISMLVFDGIDTYKSETKIVRDTIVQVVTPEPIEIEKVKTKIKYIRDTVIKTQAFVASLDTIIKRDTIRCYYAFPDNLLSLRIAREQDTLITHQINYTQQTIKKSPWWHDPLIILGGVISGYAIKSMED